MNPELDIQGVIPTSPSQQAILRIYEEGAHISGGTYDQSSKKIKLPDDIDSIVKKFDEVSENKRPTDAEVRKYKLWLEQHYRSPYTGRFIPLAKLFTSAYEIEHIIPRSRYFDDSLSNKVICESEVNKLKDNQLGFEFIKNHHGEKVTDNIEILSTDAYTELVKTNYANNSAKRKKLLLDDIPDDFNNRQLNDTRYISKYIKGLLSNIVREKDANGNYEPEATSKNLIVCNGAITDTLKKDWGANIAWNKIILPRFVKMNEITGTEYYTAVSKEGHTIPTMPFSQQKGFSFKRIDHRHHAMDAIVIACTTREHVNLLNNESARSENIGLKKALSHKLRRYEPAEINGIQRNVPKEFLKPWSSFNHDMQVALENIIVSFKQNTKVISSTSNWTYHFENGKKVLRKQSDGNNIAIRKPLHAATVSGLVNLRQIKEVSLANAIKEPQNIVDKPLKKSIIGLLKKGLSTKDVESYINAQKDIYGNTNRIKVYYFSNDNKKEKLYAVRKNLDDKFDSKFIKKNVVDQGTANILLRFLESKNGDASVAFSPEGIEEMNAGIGKWNNNHQHQPIYSVRTYKASAYKYAIGNNGNKSSKFVTAEEGTNLFFAVYEKEEIDKNGEPCRKRTFNSIPLNMIINAQKQNHKNWIPIADKLIKKNGLIPEDYKFSFFLSPGDLIYIPEENGTQNEIKKSSIYKIVKFTGSQIYRINYFVSSVIVDKQEFKSQNCLELKSEEKQKLLPIKVDRLGNIILK